MSVQSLSHPTEEVSSNVCSTPDGLNSNPEILQVHGPSHDSVVGKLGLVQIGKGLMVCLKDEFPSIQVHQELLDCPCHRQAFRTAIQQDDAGESGLESRPAVHGRLW